MASSVKAHAISAVRLVLVVGGTVLVAATLRALLSIPPAPPDGDGFVTGMAYVVWGVVLVVSFAVAGLGVVLPAVLGADDSLGFGDAQRSLLKLAGGLLVGGFLLGVILTLAVAVEVGVLLWIAATLLGVLGISVALAWRLAEAIRDRPVRAGGGDA